MFNCMNMFSSFEGPTMSYPMNSLFLGGLFPILGILKFMILSALIYFTITFAISKLNLSSKNSESVLDILNKKFASGEINEEEFLHRKSILNK